MANANVVNEKLEALRRERSRTKVAGSGIEKVRQQKRQEKENARLFS